MINLLFQRESVPTDNSVAALKRRRSVGPSSRTTPKKPPKKKARRASAPSVSSEINSSSSELHCNNRKPLSETSEKPSEPHSSSTTTKSKRHDRSLKQEKKAPRIRVAHSKLSEKKLDRLALFRGLFETPETSVKNCTHLVMPVILKHGENVLKCRTLKYFYAVLSGCWIVAPECKSMKKISCIGASQRWWRCQHTCPCFLAVMVDGDGDGDVVCRVGRLYSQG